MSTIPFGFDSALAHAKSLKPYSNMGISAALVIELAGYIEQLQARIAELEARNTLLAGMAKTGTEAAELAMNLSTECDKLRAKVAELERVAAIGRRAVEMLRIIEWPRGPATGLKYCPHCAHSGDHHELCELAAILRDAEQAAQEPDTAAVAAAALAELREAVTFFDSVDFAFDRDPLPERGSVKYARNKIIEAARRLLAGGGQ